MVAGEKELEGNQNQPDIALEQGSETMDVKDDVPLDYGQGTKGLNYTGGLDMPVPHQMAAAMDRRIGEGGRRDEGEGEEEEDPVADTASAGDEEMQGWDQNQNMGPGTQAWWEDPDGEDWATT